MSNTTNKDLILEGIRLLKTIATVIGALIAGLLIYTYVYKPNLSGENLNSPEMQNFGQDPIGEEIKHE